MSIVIMSILLTFVCLDTNTFVFLNNLNVGLLLVTEYIHIVFR